jgi:hypothetical protein
MGTRTQSWQFYTSSDGTTWSANAAGNQTYSGTNTAIVFNPPESIATTVSIPSLSIASGSSFYLRWSYVTTGTWTNAQGLGIDDFTMSLTTAGSGGVPEIDPATGSSAVSIIAAVLAMIEQRRRRATVLIGLSQALRSRSLRDAPPEFAGTTKNAAG